MQIKIAIIHRTCQKNGSAPVPPALSAPVINIEGSTKCATLQCRFSWLRLQVRFYIYKQCRIVGVLLFLCWVLAANMTAEDLHRLLRIDIQALQHTKKIFHFFSWCWIKRWVCSITQSFLEPNPNNISLPIYPLHYIAKKQLKSITWNITFFYFFCIFCIFPALPDILSVQALHIPIICCTFAADLAAKSGTTLHN